MKTWIPWVDRCLDEEAGGWLYREAQRLCFHCQRKQCLAWMLPPILYRQACLETMWRDENGMVPARLIEWPDLFGVPAYKWDRLILVLDGGWGLGIEMNPDTRESREVPVPNFNPRKRTTPEWRHVLWV